MEVPRYLWVFLILVLIAIAGTAAIGNDSHNGKLALNKDAVVVAHKSDSKHSSVDAGGNDSFPELSRIEEVLRQWFIKDSDIANGSNRSLNIFLCLQESCKWSKEECEHPPEQKSGAGPTSLMDELIEQFQEVWNSPPQDGAVTFRLAFLGSWFGSVMFLVLVLILWLGGCCCRKLVCANKRKGDKLYQRFKEKRLFLRLPSGRKLPIEEYVIDASSDQPNVLLIPMTTTTDGILTSEIVLRRSPVSGGRYRSNNENNPEDGRMKCRKARLNKRQRTDSGTYYRYLQPTDNEHSGYLNEGFRASNEDMVFPQDAPGELVEPTGSTNNYYEVPAERNTGPQEMQELEDDDDEPSHTTVDLEFHEGDKETEM